MTDAERIQTVRIFAKNALTLHKFSERRNAPVFADGVDLNSGRPVVWRNPHEPEIVISNLACQQNFMRTLEMISALTGESQWGDAARQATAWMLGQAVDSSGLLFWGSHRMIDLRTLTPRGPAGKPAVHELKNVLPFYELMQEINPSAFNRFVDAFWNAHVLDWSSMSINRHGRYNQPIGTLWNHSPIQQLPFLPSDGLSFLNGANDLIWAAGTVAQTTGNSQIAAWARHLAHQFVAARDPKTGLGSYQFTQSRKIAEAPSDSATHSKYGDRAARQLGPELGADVLEAKMLTGREAHTIYGENALMQLELARQLGPAAGADFLEWTVAGLRAFATYAYITATNQCRPMLINGYDLDDFELKRDGYYGPKGTILRRYSASAFLLPFARASLATKDELCWRTAASIAKGIGLGDLGRKPGIGVKVETHTELSDSNVVFALVDLYRATGCFDYLHLARKIGDNIVEAHFKDGWFLTSAHEADDQEGSRRNLLRTRAVQCASIDSIDALALTTLHAAIVDRCDSIKVYLGGRGCIHGNYESQDGNLITDMYDTALYTA